MGKEVGESGRSWGGENMITYIGYEKIKSIFFNYKK